MKVRRIVPNIATSDVEKANAFYKDVLGLDILMDMGWIRTFGSGAKMTVQMSVMSEGGSGTEVPEISIEVDDVEEALRRVRKAASRSNTARPTSRGACEGSSSAIRSESWSTSCSISSALGGEEAFEEARGAPAGGEVNLVVVAVVAARF